MTPQTLIPPLGDRLMKARRIARVSQKQTAEALKISLRSITRYEEALVRCYQHLAGAALVLESSCGRYPSLPSPVMRGHRSCRGLDVRTHAKEPPPTGAGTGRRGLRFGRG